MPLFVTHPQHGIGVAAGRGKRTGTVRVLFHAGQTFDLHPAAVDLADPDDLKARLPRAARNFVRKHSGTVRAKGPKLVPSRGRPEEVLSERLFRRFLTGVINLDRVEQITAFNGLVSIAESACRKLACRPTLADTVTRGSILSSLTPSDMNAASLAAIVLMRCWRGVEGYDPRYFGRKCAQLLVDDIRRMRAEKRGGKVKWEAPPEPYDADPESDEDWVNRRLHDSAEPNPLFARGFSGHELERAIIAHERKELYGKMPPAPAPVPTKHSVCVCGECRHPVSHSLPTINNIPLPASVDTLRGICGGVTYSKWERLPGDKKKRPTFKPFTRWYDGIPLRALMTALWGSFEDPVESFLKPPKPRRPVALPYDAEALKKYFGIE